MFIPMISSLRRCGSVGMACSRRTSCQQDRSIPPRSNTAQRLRAMPTMLIFSPRVRMSCSRWCAIWSIRRPPTVPMPQRKRLSSWYSERKKLSWMTLSDLRSWRRSTMKEMLDSAAPWARAITLMPLRPRVVKSLPAMPACCFMFSPITATAASSLRTSIGLMAPLSISRAKASASTARARSASARLTPMEMPVSEADWLTRNALICSWARAPKMRLSTPTMPTMEVPDRVIRLMSSIEEMPLMEVAPGATFFLTIVPGAFKLKVFRIKIGIPFAQTG